ncbi:MAG: NADH-quinone oxidoreductase subunit NuoK [Candidatus Krumholzibacteria bacterium]|nr:NADH-quinone oxidoreductase subunit NuoK [Candidatus Krumholzibacteria bacterium]MDY0108723.1 NADH-quinone oxidoreductase subunit NuoK [Candidatus Krumholzibacteria bacterium]
MAIGLTHYLGLAAAVFLVGMVGFVIRRNTIVMLMCVELMLAAANLTFAAFSRELGNEAGHVFVLMNFAVAAAEVAIGLAILVEIYRRRRSVDADELTTLME